MSYINVVPLLGSHFNLYFPMILLVWSGITAGGLGSKLMAKLPCSHRVRQLGGAENLEDAVAELFDDSVVSVEGQQLLEKERQRLVALNSGFSTSRNAAVLARGLAGGAERQASNVVDAEAGLEIDPNTSPARSNSQADLLAPPDILSDAPERDSVAGRSAKVGWRSRLAHGRDRVIPAAPSAAASATELAGSDASSTANPVAADSRFESRPGGAGRFAALRQAHARQAEQRVAGASSAGAARPAPTHSDE